MKRLSGRRAARRWIYLAQEYQDLRFTRSGAVYGDTGKGWRRLPEDEVARIRRAVGERLAPGSAR